MAEIENITVPVNIEELNDTSSLMDNALIESQESMTTTNQQIGKEESLLDFDTSILGKYRMQEYWNSPLSFDARVFCFNKEIVTCECAIDLEEGIFETRDYPSILFAHIENLKKKYPVIINIFTKPGASKIEIIDGVNLVDSSIFEKKIDWSELEDSGLDEDKSYQYD